MSAWTFCTVFGRHYIRLRLRVRLHQWNLTYVWNVAVGFEFPALEK